MVRQAFKRIVLEAEEVARFYNQVAMANQLHEKFTRRWARNALPKVLEAMRKYTEYRRKRTMQKQQADELRRYLLASIHWRALRKYSGMGDKRLMQMRTLDRYLAETKPMKMAERVVDALKKNLNKKATKEQNLRKAMKFNLLRTQRYYVMLRAWARLRDNVPVTLYR